MLDITLLRSQVLTSRALPKKSQKRVQLIGLLLSLRFISGFDHVVSICASAGPRGLTFEIHHMLGTALMVSISYGVTQLQMAKGVPKFIGLIQPLLSAIPHSDAKVCNNP